MKATRLIGAFAAAMFLGGVATYAQRGTPPPDPPTSGPPTIAGLWVVQDPGSGSFNDWMFNGPPGTKADVFPEVKRLNDIEDARLKAGFVTNTQEQTPDCPRGNLPLAWASSGIQVGTLTPTEFRMTGEVIYLDGRPHPDIKSPTFVPSATGHGIGHWEGDTLVADLVGFPAKSCDSRYPNWRVPGGGRLSLTTHLVERFRLTDPNTLQIVFTWDDPKIYLKPLTYTYYFKRTVRPTEDPAQPTPTRKFLTDELWKNPPAEAK